jgi:hypothetical protein
VQHERVKDAGQGMRGLAVAGAGVGVLRRPLAQGPRRVLKQLRAGPDAHHRVSGALRGTGHRGRGPQLTNAEIAEVLLQAPIYCDVPVAPPRPGRADLRPAAQAHRYTAFRSRSARLRALTCG